MIILSDRHHGDLYYSHQLLFEKRLGHQLYMQIGMDWATEGFWHVYDHPDTQKQFLMDGYIPKDGTPPLNGVSRIENGIHYIKDEVHHCEEKAITLDQFKSMKFDIVMCSMPQHIEPFKKLIREYQPQAKFVFHMGNMFNEVNFNQIPNLLASTVEFPVPSTCNAVFYHQEFSADLFKPNGNKPKKKITSFINLLPKTGHMERWYSLKQELYEYEFKSYGILCDDGIVSGIENIAAIMNESAWGWHAKWGGDGYGHILYNWFASGKPIITCFSDYKDKLGGELLEDKVTAINADLYSDREITDMIRSMPPLQYEYMCQQAYNRFQEKVDFDTEQVKVQNWLERML